MDADMKLFLSIVLLIVVTFTLINTLNRTRRRLKTEKFKQKVIESNHDNYATDSSLPAYEQDPLFDDIDVSHKYSEQAFTTKGDGADYNDALVSIFILPRSRNGFSGRALLQAMNANHFIHGKQDIFHRHQNDDPQAPTLYSVASITEPGFFDLETIPRTTYHGMVLFFVSTKQSDPIATLDSMLSSARKLAAGLNGEICDNRRSHLTSQTISHMREVISENHRRKLAAAQRAG